MSLLGAYLENFYRPGDRFQSVWARLEHRQQAEPTRASRRHPPIGRPKAKPSKEGEELNHLEFWATLPERVRVELRKHSGSTKTTITVGQKCWELDADGGVAFEENPEPPRGVVADLLPTEFRRHFDPRQIRSFFESLTLEELGAVEIAGQPCVRIRAIPMAGDSLWPHWLPIGADSFEFAGDLERGALLRIIALSESREFSSYEVTHINYDVAIDDARFACPVSNPNEVETRAPVTRRVELDEAKAVLPFRAILPGGSAAVAKYQFHLMMTRKADSLPSLTAFTSDPMQRLYFTLSAGGDDEDTRDLEWEELGHGDMKYQLSDPQVPEGQKVLRFSKHGTTVTIISAKPLEELLQFAATFELVE
jgi:hypothetical protein